MDEEKIAQDLAAKAESESGPKHDFNVPKEDDKPVGETGTEPASSSPENNPDDPLVTFQNRQALLEHFNIYRSVGSNGQNEQYIEDVLNFVRRETGSTETADLLKYVNDIERMQGNTLKGNRLTKFHQFVVIRNQVRRLQEQERTIYG